MNTYLIIISIFLMTWLQHSSCGLQKWEYRPDATINCTNDWDWEQNHRNLTSLNRMRLNGDPQRLRTYLDAYETSVKNANEHYPPLKYKLTPQPELNKKTLKVVQNEFITNPNGEYSLNFELGEKLRRIETGAFEKSANESVFVVRGLIFGTVEHLISYKLDNTGLYLQSYPNIEKQYVDLAAKAVLCGCCGQYGTCSALCDVAAAAHEDCPPKVLSGDNLPKIKEQFFKVNPNGSYEMRIFFANNFYERSELIKFSEDLSLFHLIGFFSEPKNPQNDLIYYFRPETKELSVGLERFPDLFPCIVPISTAAGPQDYSNIGQQVLKALVG